MRGRYAALFIAVDLLLAGCAPLRATHPPGTEARPSPAGNGHIVRIAQIAPGANFVLCGGAVPCPEPTRKTLDMPVSLPPPTVSFTPVTVPAQKKAPVVRSLTVRFAFARAQPMARDLGPLQGVMEDMRTAERITLRGRTDAVGGKQENDRLARRRAEAVREYLIGYGVDAGRIGIEAEGKCCYAASNGTPAGRAANRRVEVVITVVMKSGE